MVVFAAGNKYKMYQGQKPVNIHGVYFVFAFKWIKSRNEWKAQPATYNIGNHFEDITDE